MNIFKIKYQNGMERTRIYFLIGLSMQFLDYPSEIDLWFVLHHQYHFPSRFRQNK